MLHCNADIAACACRGLFDLFAKLAEIVSGLGGDGYGQQSSQRNADPDSHGAIVAPLHRSGASTIAAR